MPVIDHWTIVDTGSTDGTQSLVSEVLAAIPGQCVDRPWENFAHNRTEAFRIAESKTDYLLVLDADDRLELDQGTTKAFLAAQLDCDAHFLTVIDNDTSYGRLHFFRSSCRWRYEGVVHEYAVCDQPHSKGQISGARYIRIGGGNRSVENNKFERDIKVLLDALKSEPDNSRYV
ncbi:MAG: glycosyltransferase, partial [Planctomycetota bacterium]